MKGNRQNIYDSKKMYSPSAACCDLRLNSFQVIFVSAGKIGGDKKGLKKILAFSGKKQSASSRLLLGTHLPEGRLPAPHRLLRQGGREAPEGQTRRRNVSGTAQRGIRDPVGSFESTAGVVLFAQVHPASELVPKGPLLGPFPAGLAEPVPGQREPGEGSGGLGGTALAPAAQSGRVNHLSRASRCSPVT